MLILLGVESLKRLECCSEDILYVLLHLIVTIALSRTVVLNLNSTKKTRFVGGVRRGTSGKQKEETKMYKKPL